MGYPSFNTGDVLAAADMNAVGMWLIKTQTVGSSQSSVLVSDAFSTNYDVYRITYTGGTLSGNALLAVYMGASAGSAYYGSRNAVNNAGTATPAGDNNVSRWNYIAYGSTSSVTADFMLYNPFQSIRTNVHAVYQEGSTTFGTYTGTLDNTTSYTSFTFDPDGTATMSGGVIRVYGFKK